MILSPVNKDNAKKLNSIQAMRGIAALLVMLFHFRVYFNLPFYDFGNVLFSSGEIGVTIFFMISGFIMEHTHRKSGKNEAISFAIKRIVRIYPLYFISTILWILIINIFDNESVDISFSNVVKSLLFYPLSNNGAPHFGYSTLYVGWTLNYEMIFYFTFFISVFFQKIRSIILYSIWLSSLTILPFLATGKISITPSVDYEFSINYVQLISNPIVLNFIIGVTIAKVLNKKTINFSKELSITLIIMTSTFCWWQYINNVNPGTGIGQWGIGIAVLLFLLINHEISFSMKVPSFLVHLGRISFSLYLLHSIVQLLIESIFIKVGVVHYALGLQMGILCIVTSLIFSHISQKTIESLLSNKINDFIFHVLKLK
ncbi:acyltransferase family protein [Xenorhabdus bovienii]|uniref:acyltransferase family protein n=1 Tax=Xenorhabdus bovienii TaxID=40576 RepID=UPI003DA5A720